jgi:hypothetical protein
MPFQNLSQLRTCYGLYDKRWNCDRWLKETNSVCALHDRKTGRQPSTPRKKVKSKIMEGPRGGKYFMITEYGSSGRKVCEKKVYV